MLHLPRHIPLPFTDSYLMFSPPWDEWSGWANTDAWMVLALIPVALVVWLYRYELQLVSRFTATSLLLLRMLVLFVVISLVGLGPILAHTVSEELPGRVVIAVDRSDSMGVADPQRPAAEKLKVALGLQLARDLCTDEQLAAWIKDYETGGPPRWVGDDDPADGQSRDELAAQRHRMHDRVCERVDELTRGAFAQRLLMGDALQLLKTLASKHNVELMGFGKEAWDVPLDQIDGLFEDKEVKGEKDPNGPALGAKNGTNLLVPLTRALEKSGPESAKVLGVVVLSDGQHNERDSPVAKAIEMGEKGLPVFPVGLGSRLPPPDIAILGVKAPTTVFKDADVPVEARFRVSGLPAQDLIVQLHRAGQEKPVEERVVHHDGKQSSYIERFTQPLDKPGTETLTVSVRPALPETKEVRTDNNSQAIKVNVADDKARVLLIDGEARWEFHYLASALARDRSMQVSSVVFQQPRVGKVPEEDLRKVGNPSLALPAEPDALANFDCIVLGDVTPEQLPPAERTRLLKYVADRGGTLVIVAGKRAMPLAYQNVGGNEDAIVKLLPIEQPRLALPNPERGFPVTLTHDGGMTDFLKMENDTAKSAERWKAFPAHFWGIVGDAKPGATPLAYWKDDQPGAKRKPGEVENHNGLIVKHNYGFGRVLFLGLDSTWRWRYKTGDTYHHRFWGQVIRWAATDKPLVTGNEWVRFGTREPVYQQGQEVEVVVRLGEETHLLRPDALAGARILHRQPGKPDEAVALVPLKTRPAQPRILEGKLRDLPAGEYSIEMAVPELEEKLRGPAGPDGTPTPLRATFSVNPTASEEMADLSTNFPLLEEIAIKSGGKFFTADQARELIELIKSRSSAHEERVENRLWQWWITLAVLLSLLTLEWVGRKLAGLP